MCSPKVLNARDDIFKSLMEDLQRTEKYNRLAIEYSEFYKGKVRVMPKVPVRHLDDFSFWYTPGIAAVSRKIEAEKELSFELTGRWNSIAILTDGTRVLGLGNVGPEAAMPVMEGKALIFNFFGGVNAVPIPIRVSSKEEFMAVARALEPSFGGYNLEDIESPKCFTILETLQKSLKIPVWHDDQLGTASIILAGLINSLRLVGKKFQDARVTFVGAGAANIAAAFLLDAAGFKFSNMTLVDSKGILEPERSDMDVLMLNNPLKYQLAIKTNGERRKGGMKEAIKGADVVVSAAKQGPDTIHKDWIRDMNSNGIVFALANPVPEIWPDEAKEAGASIVATGRSDYPNQINNSLVFPGVFRGVLDARSTGVNFQVMVAASNEIANFIEDPTENNVVPTMEDWELYPRVASAVAAKTVELKLARKSGSKETFFNIANEIIQENRNIYMDLLDRKLVKPLPGVKKND